MPKHRLEDPVHIAVVGAGFSGLLTAIHLLRLSPRARVSLIERRTVFGVGTAYDTGNPHHLLNVRLDNMSAFPDQPRHLADWLAEQPSWQAQDGFISRGVYGDYLRDLLDQALDGAPDRLTLVEGEAAEITREGAGWRLSFAVSDPVYADAVVLALGNLEPASPPGVDQALAGSPVYVENPWRLDPDQVAEARDVLLIGSGLTMVDVVLTLRRPGRRFVALSRHGLLPRAHATVQPAPFEADFSGSPAQVTAQVRRAAQTHDWRAVFDRLRQSARDLWRGWTLQQRQRFLRHLRPLWDVHRHRLSPGAGREVGSLLASGELKVVAGKLAEVVRSDVVEVAWRPRHRRRVIRDRFDLVVNCTGPLGGVARSREPLIVDLLARGFGRPDTLGLGLEVDGHGRLIGSGGESSLGLYAVGPLTRGAFWEMTAVPDLRLQAVSLAERLLEDQSV